MSTAGLKRSRITPSFMLILFAAGALSMAGFLRIQRWLEARHPAVEEHRDELLEAAAQRMKCGADRLTIVAEEPVRARVEGCRQIATFRWGRVRTKSLPAHWHEIDPACRVDYMGCSMPCE